MTEHFIVAGAQRCGTTRLAQLLQQHPDIAMARPLRPEPKFFLAPEAINLGRNLYLQQHFQHRGQARLLGEKSTSYIEHPEAAARIKAVLPTAKVIFVLREPARRAWSNWCFSRQNGLEDLSFEQAINKESERLAAWQPGTHSVSPHAYFRRGLYGQYLDAWSRQYPRHAMRVLTAESLFDDDTALRNLFDWLGVEPDIAVTPVGKVNQTQAEHGAPPADSLRALRERYRSTNQQLAADWGLDISAWNP